MYKLSAAFVVTSLLGVWQTANIIIVFIYVPRVRARARACVCVCVCVGGGHLKKKKSFRGK